MEMSKDIKKKKEFKDTRVAAFIRNRIYSYWRFKRRYRRTIKKWKEQTLYVFLTVNSLILMAFVGWILVSALYRWFVLGEY